MSDNNSAEGDAIRQETRRRNDGQREYLDQFTSDRPFVPYHVAVAYQGPKKDPDARRMGILL